MMQQKGGLFFFFKNRFFSTLHKHEENLRKQQRSRSNPNIQDLSTGTLTIEKNCCMPVINIRLTP